MMKRFKSRLTVALVSLSLAVSGLTWLTYKFTDLQMREDLLQQAGIVAQSIQLERVRLLAGASSDETNPNYLKLKHQLSHLRHANPKCRFLYILGRTNDGMIFFHVDSEPAGSKDESPPGQTYDEAPISFHDVFKEVREDAVGPVSDRWGSWVTALVPLIHSDNGQFMGVLAMDIDATTWKWDIFSRILFHIGLLLILVLVIGSMWLAVHRFESGPTKN